MSNNTNPVLNQAKDNMQIITEKSVLIHLDFRQWTGACSFSAEDIEMPPKELVAAMGQKRLVDPKVLGVFSRIKDRAVALLDNAGTPFLKGWLVPVDRASFVIKGLDELKLEYEREKETFLQNLPAAYNDWAAEHPEFSRFIETARKAVNDVARRIHAQYCVCSFVPSGVDVSDSLRQEVLGLKDEILKDVMDRCRKLTDQSLTGRESISSRGARNTLATLFSKVSGLSYVDNSLVNVQTVLGQLVMMLPQGGAIEGRLLVALTTGVAMLASRKRIDEICAGSATLDETLGKMGLRDLLVAGTPQPVQPSVPKARKACGVASAKQSGASAGERQKPNSAPQAASVQVFEPMPANDGEPDLFADLDDLFFADAEPASAAAENAATAEPVEPAAETSDSVKPVLQSDQEDQAQQTQSLESVQDDGSDFVPPPPPAEMFKAMFG